MRKKKIMVVLLIVCVLLLTSAMPVFASSDSKQVKKTLLSEIMDPDFIFVQKAGTCFLYVYFQGTGFLGVSIFMGTV